MTAIALTKSATEADFVESVDCLIIAADTPRLTELLSEEHPVYSQKSTAATARMRAWILVGLGRIGLCHGSLIYVIEELDTGIEPYLVAAAAVALRSYPSKERTFARYLVHAIENIRYHDEPVNYERYGEYSEDESRTAVTEILESLEWHGAGMLTNDEMTFLRGLPDCHQEIVSRLALRADSHSTSCCEIPEIFGRFSLPSGRQVNEAALGAVLFEDQDGSVFGFREYFRGTSSIVAFFYTRCDNPFKCSLTVAKLANIQRILQKRDLQRPVRVAAITYDPEFDDTTRIRVYGADRGIEFDSHTKLLRCIRGMETVRKYFRSGSNFIGSLINRHRIEAFVLDRSGEIVATFQRMRWDEEEIIEFAVDHAEGCESVQRKNISHARSHLRRFFMGLLSILPPAAVAFFPKCPFCWAAYFSAVGLSGLELAYSPWFYPVLWFFLCIHVVSSGIRSRTTGKLYSFVMAVAGAGLLVLPAGQWSKLLAIGLIGTSSLIGSMEHQRSRLKTTARSRSSSEFVCSADDNEETP
ncbi:SCO family protein [Gimesia aquarii]|uniref:SCO1/SenC n=1 Tax=Gimesia aquarii TaxID=2527964 RepID=A0A517VWB2_9PLAN|nr:SCO family protein [Gimesia aquarii]QDT97290.1 SCO1/SenC [Gimesia aquarii]